MLDRLPDLTVALAKQAGEHDRTGSFPVGGIAEVHAAGLLTATVAPRASAFHAMNVGLPWDRLGQPGGRFGWDRRTGEDHVIAPGPRSGPWIRRLPWSATTA